MNGIVVEYYPLSPWNRNKYADCERYNITIYLLNSSKSIFRGRVEEKSLDMRKKRTAQKKTIVFQKFILMPFRDRLTTWLGFSEELFTHWSQMLINIEGFYGRQREHSFISQSIIWNPLWPHLIRTTSKYFISHRQNEMQFQFCFTYN